MPGSLFKYEGKVYVLKGTDGKHRGVPDYMVDIKGIKHLYKKCKVLKNNGGIIYVGNQP